MLNWNEIGNELGLLKTRQLLWSMLIAFLVVRLWVPSYRRRLRAPLMVTAICVVLVPVSALSAAQENLDAQAHREREGQAARDLLNKIRSFFGIDESSNS